MILAEKITIYPSVAYVYSPDDDYDFQINPEHLTQFTGLVDKTGKEIYEGDIIRLGDDLFKGLSVPGHAGLVRKNCLVGMSEGCWMYARNTYNEEFNTYLWINNSDVEVLGNIYETPELLATPVVISQTVAGAQ